MEVPIIEQEKKVAKFYNEWGPEKNKYAPYFETYSCHYGYWTTGIRTIKEAVYNMNDLAAELLCLNTSDEMKILDAGCGMGGPSIYLAKKYPNVFFTGINISEEQIKLANKLKENNKTANTEFLLQNFLNTSFPYNYFDGVFAMESSSYAADYNDFIDEMYRLLKPGGKLVVIDLFRSHSQFNSIEKRIYENLCNGYGGANYPDLHHYKFLLNYYGFTDIGIMNITKNILLGLIRPFFKNMSKLFFKKQTQYQIETTVPCNSKFLKKEFYAALSSVCGIIGFYATSATKN